MQSKLSVHNTQALLSCYYYLVISISRTSHQHITDYKIIVTRRPSFREREARFYSHVVRHVAPFCDQ